MSSSEFSEDEDAFSSSDVSSTFSFPDRFTGRTLSLSLDADDRCHPLSPAELRAQIKCPLKLFMAATWFFVQRSPCRKRLRQGSPLPLGFMSAEYSSRVPLRVMFGFVAATCQLLTTVPASMQVARRATWRWAECVMDRVTRGHVNSVQVQLPLHASPACALFAGVRTRCVFNAHFSLHWTFFG